MSQIGLGAMIHMLSGGSELDPADFLGREIVDADMSDNRLRLTFADGEAIDIWDNGQSCCEARWMTTDDDVKSLIGAKLVHIVSKDASYQADDDGYDVHETAFVEIATDQGFITIVNHNNHNGYYGGFGLTVTKAGASW